MDTERAEQLERSWHANAGAWSDAVRRGAIRSRRQGTDAAILDAIQELQPRRVLDLGCGEGWLARALTGVDIVGLDTSPVLVERARESGGGTFHVCTYAQLAAEPDRFGADFDAAICNFSLFEEDIAPVLTALQVALSPRGTLVIQTIHPWSGRGEKTYADGWRTETFSDFGPGFSEPMPWFFRKLESWMKVLGGNGYAVLDLREPVDAETGQPLSMVILAEPAV